MEYSLEERSILLLPAIIFALFKATGQKIKSNLNYTRGITHKPVTSGGVHLCDLAPGRRSFEDTSLRWRAVGDSVPDLTGLGIEPKTSCTDSGVKYKANRPLHIIDCHREALNSTIQPAGQLSF